MGTDQKVPQSKWMVTLSDLQEKNVMKDMLKTSCTRLLPRKNLYKYLKELKTIINQKNGEKVS